MIPPNRCKQKRKDLCEIEESGDFSTGSDDEWSLDSEKLVGNSDHSALEDSRSSLVEPDNDSYGNGLPFTATDGFTLKIIKNRNMSKHPVWLMFGYLMKNDKEVIRVKNKFFYKKCFDKHTYKR